MKAGRDVYKEPLRAPPSICAHFPAITFNILLQAEEGFPEEEGKNASSAEADVTH